MTKKKTMGGVLLLAITFGCAAVSCVTMPRESVTALRTGCRSADVVVAPEDTHDGLTEYDAWCGDDKWHCVAPAWGRQIVTMQCSPAKSTRTPIVAEAEENTKATESPP